MGELLAFRAQPRVARRDMPRAEGAEILFFTGVRYMRAEDHAAAVSSSRGDQVKRGPAKRCEPSQH